MFWSGRAGQHGARVMGCVGRALRGGRAEPVNAGRGGGKGQGWVGHCGGCWAGRAGHAEQDRGGGVGK